ncbi:hypothetical protein LCGC14_2252950, partial [marine sediment metagenome]
MTSLLDALEGSHQKLLRPSGGCHNCPRKRVDFVPPTLVKAPVIWLGEAPGAVEAAKGYGWAGKAGELLRDHAGKAGLKIEAFTNTIHCRPPKNSAPKPKELACCLSQFVLDEIQDYPIVVMCGSVPLQALFPKAKATHYRGNIAYHPDFPGQRFYNIYHPSYMFRRGDLMHRFDRQLERLYRIIAGEPKPDWTVLQGGGKKWMAALEKALAAPLISLDLETTALESWLPHTHIRSIAVTADAKTVLYIYEDEPHWVATLQRIQEYLERPAKGVVGANIAFDLDMLEHELDFTVMCTGIHDVSVMWCEARQYKMPSLKELTSNELDGYRYLIYDPTKETDLELLGWYNGEDVVYSLRLFWKALGILNAKTTDLTSRVLGPANLCLRQMTSNGLYVRQDYLKAKVEEYKDRRKAVINRWHDEDPEFLPTKHETGKGLKRYLFD